jgi:uncharacterized protein (TIGR03083 family)
MWFDPSVDYIAQLEADGLALAHAAKSAGWNARVPSLRWEVRELVTHTGGVHRWAADVVASAAKTTDTECGRAVGRGPADEDLLEWFIAGHSALVATLRAAPPDLQCATFLPAPSPLAFWARRQAHETAVHRADAENASGVAPSFDPMFANDGIAELLHGFASRRRKALDRTATIALRSADGPSWLVRLGGEGITAREGDYTSGDMTIDGTSSDIYLWLWNRPSAATAGGDTSLADTWASTVRVRWS